MPRRLLSDVRLARLAGRGDQRAFEAIFERYHQEIYQYCRAILSDPDEAQDALQSTMTSALRSLPGDERQIALRPWLYRVAVNLSYNRRPRKGVTFSSLDDGTDDIAAEGESPSDAAERTERRRVVLECVDTLGPKHKIVVVLHYLNGLNLAEIAEIVEVPVGTVKSRLHYALRKLRVQLSAHPGLDFEPADLLATTEEQMHGQAR